MEWWIIFAILLCLGLWWDTARQNKKIKILIEDYIYYKENNGSYEPNDILQEMKKWSDAQ